MIRSWRGAVTGLAALLAVVALGLLAAGPLGWRMGWWHYSTGFQILLPWAANAGVAAAAVSALALVAALTGGRRGLLVLALASFVAGALAIYMPWEAGSRRGVHPRVNDISTDTANPPAFVAAVAARKADGGSDSKYNTASAAEQNKSYADIAPVTSLLAPDEAFKRAAAMVTAMPRWRVIASDAAARRIEASEASRWFGFTDDVVIRVSAEAVGSRIDVRSASRHGRGDFGVNAARVRAYLAALKPRLQ